MPAAAMPATVAKLDASGVSKAATANVAEIHNQVTMMLGHEIFDPEIGKRVLVDHAFIVAGGRSRKPPGTGSVTSWTPRSGASYCSWTGMTS
jgi:hypothetical protein